MLNKILFSLLDEAAKTKSTPASDADVDDAASTTSKAADDTTGDNADTQDNANDETDTDDQGDDTNNNDDTDENTDDDTKNDENSDDSSEDDMGDDFTMDSGDEEDDSPPPDGLVDPDDDGSGDDAEDDTETNVQTTILQLSKLDRTLLKRKCYNDYQDLRSSITTFKNVIDDNEASIDPEVRDYVLDELDQLYNSVTDYMKYKFMIMNYEECIKNYAIFIAALNNLVEYVKNGGDKPLKKLTVEKTPKKKSAAKKKTEPKSGDFEVPENIDSESEDAESSEEEPAEETEEK